MRICCVEIDKHNAEGVATRELEFNCAQTGKSTIKDLIEQKLIEFLGVENGPYDVTASTYHVCAVSKDGMKVGFGNPVKSTTKLTDSLREYDKDWSEVDNYLMSLKPEELTSNEILAEMQKKWPDFTLTNVYYRLRVNGINYQKSRRGKKIKYSL